MESFLIAVASMAVVLGIMILVHEFGHFAAAKLLGVNLSGDAKDKQSQPLSDAKLREAQGLLQNVLGSSEVKSQKRVSKHIVEAINQLSIALSIR